jgi:hypothetical protein
VLLIKASEDEAALYGTGNPDAVLGFHAQQAVELTHNLLRLEKALRDLGESLPQTPVPLSDLNDFAVEYRYELLFQHTSPDVAELQQTVRLIREHVVTRITALSAAP